MKRLKIVNRPWIAIPLAALVWAGLTNWAGIDAAGNASAHPSRAPQPHPSPCTEANTAYHPGCPPALTASPTPTPTPTPHPLLTDLKAYWKMDEVSGVRADSVNGYDLTDNNTVGSNTGIISNAADFVLLNSENLTRADNDDLSACQCDWTGRIWVYLGSKATLQVLWHKFNTVSTNSDYSLFYDNVADRFKVRLYNTTNNDAVADNLGSPSINTWYHIVFWRNQTAGTINIKINNGTTNTTAIGGSEVGQTWTGTLRIGGVATAFMQGRADEAAFWKRLLTAGEITEDYNAGAGKTYPWN